MPVQLRLFNQAHRKRSFAFRPWRPLTAVAFTAGLLLASVLFWISFAPPSVTIELQTKKITHEQGLTFTFPIEVQARFPFAILSDGQANHSTFRLFEDGWPLGPAHTPYQIIRDWGGGAFVHWGGLLYFSTSDGSDPTLNQRRYTAVVQPLLERSTFLTALGIALLLLIFGWTYSAPPKMQPRGNLTGIEQAHPGSLFLKITLLRITLYFCLFCGALAYNGYGAPEYWFSDELLWVIEGMLSRRDPNPNFFTYPAGLHIHLTYTVYRLLALIHDTAQVSRELLIHTGRTIAAVFFILTVYCAERTVSVLKGNDYDIKTIILVGTSCALIHHAHIATAQPSVFFAISLCYMTFSYAIVLKSARAYYSAAFACGMAVGAKYNAIYIGVALPVLYTFIFRPKLTVFLMGMIKTAMVAGTAVFLLNPFILMTFQKFKTDLLDTAFKEAPAFQSVDTGIDILATSIQAYGQAFFSKPGVIIVAGWLGFALLAFPVFLITRRRFPNLWRNSKDDCVRLARLYTILAIILITNLAYCVIQIYINIQQSRYYIPLWLGVAISFSISVDIVRTLISLPLGLRRWWLLVLPMHLILGVCLAMVLTLGVLNGVIYVAAFPLSAKIVAQRSLENLLRTKPNLRIVRLAYGDRTPVLIDPVLCAGRCPTIRVERLSVEQTINSWDEFLGAISKEIQKFDPDVVIAEEILFYWEVFIPTTLQSDYSQRLNFPNPGPGAWKALFRALGYEKSRAFDRISGHEKISTIIGDRYVTALEGIGGSVYTFAKSRAW